jgi:hypothetical protein
MRRNHLNSSLSGSLIIADLTEPSSIPKELEAHVPTIAVPVQPLWQGQRDHMPCLGIIGHTNGCSKHIDTMHLKSYWPFFD